MKTIKNSKDITTLEVGDLVVFGNLEYRVSTGGTYFLTRYGDNNDRIFKVLHLNKRDFVEKLGIDAHYICDFPETKSLEALTAIVSALFKEYEKQNELPKTWEEFCERNPIKRGECIIDIFSNIQETLGGKRSAKEDKNYCISEQEAESFIALMQLRQLRKAYVKDWEPDWTNRKVLKYSITSIEGVLNIFGTVTVHYSMSFPTEKLAKQFLDNFKDLLEIAKPLL